MVDIPRGNKSTIAAIIKNGKVRSGKKEIRRFTIFAKITDGAVIKGRLHLSYKIDASLCSRGTPKSATRCAAIALHRMLPKFVTA